MKDFYIYAGPSQAGIKIRLTDKITLSLVNGAGTYTDNMLKYDAKMENNAYRFISNDCEIALLDNNGKLITDEILNNGEDIVRYLKYDGLVNIIKIVAGIKKDT